MGEELSLLYIGMSKYGYDAYFVYTKVSYGWEYLYAIELIEPREYKDLFLSRSYK